MTSDDLIDTPLTAKDKWLGEKEQLTEKFFLAEKQFHESQSLLKDQLLASESKVSFLARFADPR